MHWISVLIGVVTVSFGSRRGPCGTLFAAGVFLAIVGWPIQLIGDPTWSEMGSRVNHVGVIAAALGSVEVAWRLATSRWLRHRMVVKDKVDIGTLMADIHKMAAKCQPGEKLTVEVVKEGRPRRTNRDPA